MAVVSLVGRPNTGKSALFNRIAKERLAIVFDQSGVTRDRISRKVDILGRSVLLVDTGGMAFDERAGSLGRQASEDKLIRETREQAALAVEDSDLCVIVVDSRDGVTPLDEEVISRLRESGVKCIIAANKCDLPKDDLKAADFASFGLKTISISAEHSRGIDALMKAIVAELPPKTQEEEEDDALRLKVAILGRPNVGKSSFVNRLVGKERVIVSDVPGTTRDAIDVPFSTGSGPSARNYLLIDTAGLKPHTKMSKTSVDNFSLFRTEAAIERADAVLLFLDASMGPTMQDKKIAAKILEAKKGCAIIVNKWDKAQEEGLEEDKAAEAIKEMMPFMPFAPIVFSSTLTGYNIRKTLATVDEVAQATTLRLPTGMLNRTIEIAAKRTLAPMVRGKRFKIYYALQTGARPQTICLFCNNPKLATNAYLTYLEKAVRTRFSLMGAPIVWTLKERKRPSLTGGAQNK